MKIRLIVKVCALCTVLFSVTGCIYDPVFVAKTLEAVTSPYHTYAPNDANRGCVYKDTALGLEWVCPEDSDEYYD